MAKKHVEPQGFAQPVAYERCARSGCRNEAVRDNPNDERERVCEGCYAVELARWHRWVCAGRPTWRSAPKRDPGEDDEG